MDENKNEILEDTVEAVEETVETVEEIAEAVEEAMEAVEVEDGMTVIEEDSTEAEKYVDVERLAKEVKSLKLKNRILSVILAIIVLAAAVFGGYKAVSSYNPYNKMGVPNTSGMTLKDMASMYGVSVDTIKEQYQLPENVKDNTYAEVVMYLAPVSLVVQAQFGMDFATAKEELKFSDDITEDSLWFDAEATIPVSIYVGTGDALAAFVAEYNLPETVTEDTPWGEIREQVLNFEYERANAPVEEVEEPEVVDVPELSEDETAPVELSSEELAEILEYLENSTEVVE